MTITFHEDAEAELVDASLYYEDQAAGLGHRFREDVRAITETIEQYPEAAPLTHYGVRAKTVGSFPYTVMYVPEAAEIFIVAIAPQSRRPGYWADRLTSRYGR